MRLPTAAKVQIGAARGSVPTTAMKRGLGNVPGTAQATGARPMTAVSGAGYSSKQNQVSHDNSNIAVSLEPKIETLVKNIIDKAYNISINR